MLDGQTEQFVQRAVAKSLDDPSAPRRHRRGVSLIEVLVGLVIVVVASIATLNYFAYALGGVGKTGNRRAALERARERLEQLLAENVDAITPAIDPTQPLDNQPQRWLSCTGSPCTWAISNVQVTETVNVDDLPNQQMETMVQRIEDVDSPPPPEVDLTDALALDVKVWFTSDVLADNDFNRVRLRALRAL